MFNLPQGRRHISSTQTEMKHKRESKIKQNDFKKVKSSKKKKTIEQYHKKM